MEQKIRKQRYGRIKELPKDVYLITDYYLNKKEKVNTQTSHSLVAECPSENEAKRLVILLNRTLRKMSL